MKRLVVGMACCLLELMLKLQQLLLDMMTLLGARLLMSAALVIKRRQ